MGKIKDLTGKRFGKLTVIKYLGKNKDNRVIWLVLQDLLVKKVDRE